MKTDLSELVQSLVTDGTFGEGKFLRLGHDTSSDVGPQWASQIQRKVLRVERPSGKTVEFPLVIKQQLESSFEREFRDAACQFANEVAMYRDVLPFLKITSSEGRFYPKMFYGTANGGLHLEEDLLILEDLSPEGFIVSKHKIFLDFKHIELALKRIGEFHSWSYRAKKLYPADFAEKAKLLKVPEMKLDEKIHLSFVRYLKKSLQPFLDKTTEIENFNRLIDILSDINFLKVFLHLNSGPFTTIIHGDFCKNNVFYKYDSEGNPTECVLFDFQQSKYASPGLDLSFFLYLHTTAELREKHWDDFLQIYWSTVEESCRDLEMPSYSDFLEEFAKNAVYGFLICGFFLPMMLAEKILSPEQMINLSEEERNEYIDNLGGPEASIAITDIIKHLVDRNYINKSVEHCYSVNK